MPRKTKIINGIIVSAFPPIPRICIGFFLTAILVDYSEVKDFGIWKLALSVFGASWVLQLGINSVIFALLVVFCGYLIAAISNERQRLKTSILRVASK